VSATIDGPRDLRINRGGSAAGTHVLRGLYGSFVALQVLDVVSTRRVLGLGGVESNPIMAPFVRNTGTFIALKAAGTATTVLLTEKLSKKSRIAAIATAVAVNSAYAMVVSHNFKVARTLEGRRSRTFVPRSSMSRR
jgi:hypothetical protein